ncbi:AraC family transcriptional regulator [Neisseriaceae bacterium JH1-16]|nr:AraC family transcriptional regulator [Neisseriaceae bacterium JH1-16]
MEARFWHGDGWTLREAHDSAACYAPHLHDTASLGQVLAGTSRCQIRRHIEPIGAGSCVWVREDEVHACNPAPDQRWAYRMLHLDTRALAERARELDRPLPGNRLLNTKPALFGRLDALATALAQGETLAADQALWRTLAQLLGADETAPAHPHAIAPGLARARDYLADHACTAVPLARLAEQAGLSPWRLLRGFAAAYGQTPHAWQLAQRVSLARRWLEAGRPLAEVALAAGFADQSHFSRVFKAHTALSPGRYRTLAGRG